MSARVIHFGPESKAMTLAEIAALARRKQGHGDV